MKILGIDPGSRTIGYGLIEDESKNPSYLLSGVFRCSGKLPVEYRLKKIYQELIQLCSTHQPDVLVVEKVFFALNANSALVLGQVRGVCLLVGALHNLTIQEFNPTKVKQAVTGNGNANKQQVQLMVSLLLNSPKTLKEDESDALALALCYTQSARWMAVQTACLTSSKL